MEIELRDWLAQHASDEDLLQYMSMSGADGSRLMYRARAGLREQARYEYADAMLKARKGDHDGQ